MRVLVCFVVERSFLGNLRALEMIQTFTFIVKMFLKKIFYNGIKLTCYRVYYRDDGNDNFTRLVRNRRVLKQQ